VFTLRFDMRAPGADPAATRALYAAALEMAAWGEAHGCLAVQVSEHHASPDGYLPAPLLLASAMAARTERLPIQVAALLVPLHDPIRLAEDMAVLDLLSGGRVSYVMALGYRPEEYAMFGRSMRTRGRRMEECLAALRRAWSGEPFCYEGRPVCVTPRPATPGGPVLWMGGNSPAAARRAARFGMGLLAQGGDPSLAEVYRAACREAGVEPGPCIVPPPGTVTSAFVAEDPDRAWSELGPHLLHDARTYAAWLGDQPAASRSEARSVAELRAERGPYRIFTPGEAVAHVRAHGILMLQPLCGGLPPARAWESLELMADRVLPALARPEA
jgi:alkanesulfonate monooxygenase SsuD/methylene tetrahydromethanopterin reductase-like flavin-dependent oxidoreductase (luciferase family)